MEALAAARSATDDPDDSRAEVLGAAQISALTGLVTTALGAPGDPTAAAVVDDVRAFEAYVNEARPDDHPPVDLLVEAPDGERLVDPWSSEAGPLRDMTMVRLVQLATGVVDDGSRLAPEHGGDIATLLDDPISQLSAGFVAGGSRGSP